MLSGCSARMVIVMDKRQLVPLLALPMVACSLASQPVRAQAPFDATLPIIRSNLQLGTSGAYPQDVFMLTQPSIIAPGYYMPPARPNIYVVPPLLLPSEGAPSLGYGTDMFIQSE